MTGRLGIADVSPVVSCGRYPARAVVCEAIRIEATVFGEGHDAVAANVAFAAPPAAPPARQGNQAKPRRRPAPPLLRMTAEGNDAFSVSVRPTAQGLWTYRIEAWSDPYATWAHAVRVKYDAGQGQEELANDLADGARLLTRAAAGVPKEHRGTVQRAAAALAGTGDLAHRIAPGLSAELADLLDRHPVRELVTRGQTYQIWVDRPRALFGSWYEFFPRSENGVGTGPTVLPEGSVLADGSALAHEPAADPSAHGTFATAARRLPAIRDMGFDVVYLPPIHPIGTVNRKGPNNTLVAGPSDVGSPWAIGSADGGHDAVHAQLGTIEDFDAFVARTCELGMEVALDFALQCAPDHPWVTSHPEWFTTRPDGSIAYAENPPKKYQDIYPLNFDNDPKGLYAECLRVITHWIDHGVKIFRVDNPHTKPLDFWAWLIWRVKADHPDVLFLAEAFTRPAMMHELARIGFTQSYTYFTWRTEKRELEEYGSELVESADYLRPNFFVNTPDILHASLQYGGPPMFTVRAVLASMLSPTWGVYSGFELFEHQALRPGSEEYLDSEKYQLRPRDWAAAEREGRSLAPYLTMLNQVRRAHPALKSIRSLHAHAVDSDVIIAWSKRDTDTGDTVLVVLNLDPHGTREAMVSLDMPALGLDWHDRFVAHDEVTGQDFDWGRVNYVRLDPWHQPAHILTVGGPGA